MSQRLITGFFLIIFVMSCATQKTRKEPSRRAEKVEKNQGVEFQPAPVKEEPESPTAPSSPSVSAGDESETPQGPKQINVWVDSMGFDFFLALGFLQEVERKGYQIKSIVGSGSACLLAVAFGQRGSLNEAEYQGFKLDEIPFASGTEILGKLKSMKSRIRSVFEKNFSSLSLGGGRGQVACAFIKGGQLVLERRASAVEVLAASFEIPRTLGALPTGTSFGYPANFVMSPSREDLEKARKDFSNSDSWLLVKTFDHSEFLDSSHASLWHILYRLKGVGDKNLESEEMRWQKVNLARLRKVKSDDFLKGSERRSFLLGGRQAGKAWTPPIALFSEVRE